MTQQLWTLTPLTTRQKTTNPPFRLMIKRPINPQFADAVLTGRKFTTIREKPWPVGVPIMLYHWSGRAYDSPQIDLTPIKVTGYWPIRITHRPDGTMRYEHGMEHALPLYETEGFPSRAAMNDWFRPLVKPGTTIVQTLHRFRLVTRTPAKQELLFAS